MKALKAGRIGRPVVDAVKREQLADEPKVLASTEERTAGAISAQLTMNHRVEAKELIGSAAEPLHGHNRRVQPDVPDAAGRK